MRRLVWTLLIAVTACAQNTPSLIPADEAVRIREFYRFAEKVQNQIWPGWSDTPSPLLLVTRDSEFLTHHPSPPQDFKLTNDNFLARPRQFSTNLLATFPAFGPPSVIVIGEPANTTAKTSSPWLIIVMHEHFHQLQDEQAGYYEAVKSLGLSHGDITGMWMLNYPFPYEKPQVIRSFSALRDLLLGAVNEQDQAKFQALASTYVEQRKKFSSQLSDSDRKYFEFQLWKEGIARYTQVKCAEAAAHYQPSAEFAALPDYLPLANYAADARTNTLDELKRADLREWKRDVVYSFGAAEGLLLDRMNPTWKDNYFKHPLSLSLFFEK